MLTTILLKSLPRLRYQLSIMTIFDNMMASKNWDSRLLRAVSDCIECKKIEFIEPIAYDEIFQDINENWIVNFAINAMITGCVDTNGNHLKTPKEFEIEGRAHILLIPENFPLHALDTHVSTMPMEIKFHALRVARK
jgi:hypothetical protein